MKKLKLNKKRLGVLLDSQMSAIQAGQGEAGNTQETVDNTCDNTETTTQDTCRTKRTTEITTSRPIYNTSNPPRTCLG